MDKILSENKVNIRLPSEVYELYNWKNGTSGIGMVDAMTEEVRMFTMGIFLPLSFAIENYLFHAVQNKYWDKNFFPLFESGGGDFFLIDCNEKSATYRRILYFSPIELFITGIITRFDGLINLIDSIIACHQQKAYQYSPSLELLVDERIEWNIFKENNPACGYYKVYKERYGG